MSEKKRSHKKKDPRPKQTEIEAEGFKQKKNAKIEKAAEKYEEVRDERMELTESEVSAKQALLMAMHEEKLDKYRYQGSDGKMRLVEVLPSEKVRVKKDRESEPEVTVESEE